MKCVAQKLLHHKRRLRLPLVARRVLLAALLPVLAGGACTANRAVPNATLSCGVTADCPPGYLCIDAGGRRVCCRNGDCGPDAGGGPQLTDGPAQDHPCDPPPAICQGRTGSTCVDGALVTCQRTGAGACLTSVSLQCRTRCVGDWPAANCDNLQLGEASLDEMDVAVSCVNQLCITGGITP